jgi:hypothetical protein
LRLLLLLLQPPPGALYDAATASSTVCAAVSHLQGSSLLSPAVAVAE